MRGFIFTLFLFSVLLAIAEVRSEKHKKLCGLEYIRTVIYICATSRWRRQLGGLPQVQQGNVTSYDSLISYYFLRLVFITVSLVTAKPLYSNY